MVLFLSGRIVTSTRRFVMTITIQDLRHRNENWTRNFQVFGPEEAYKEFRRLMQAVGQAIADDKKIGIGIACRLPSETELGPKAITAYKKLETFMEPYTR